MTDHQFAPTCPPPILRLQPELGGMFTDEMDLFDLIRWRQTCRTNYHQAVGSMRRSLYNMLKPYVSTPVALLNVLTKHRAVLGGEFALAFVLRDPSFLSKDIDIYASNHMFEATCSAILNEPLLMEELTTYTLTTNSFVDALRTLTSSTVVIDTARGKSICIHQSYTASPSAPISRAPCTALSNFVSPHGFGCSHPVLTLNRRALLADQELPEFAFSDANMESKLRKHKFSLAVSPTAWPEFRRDAAPSRPQEPGAAADATPQPIHAADEKSVTVPRAGDTQSVDSSLCMSTPTDATTPTEDETDPPFPSLLDDLPAGTLYNRTSDTVTLIDETSSTPGRFFQRSDIGTTAHSPVDDRGTVIDNSNPWPAHSVAVVRGPWRPQDSSHIALSPTDMNAYQRTLHLDGGGATTDHVLDSTIHPTTDLPLPVPPRVDAFLSTRSAAHEDNVIPPHPSRPLQTNSNRILVDITHHVIGSVSAPPNMSPNALAIDTNVFSPLTGHNTPITTTAVVGAGRGNDTPLDSAVAVRPTPEIQTTVDTPAADTANVPGSGDNTPTSESTAYSGDTEDDTLTPEPCLRNRFLCPSQGRFFGDKGSFVDFFDPLTNAENYCVQNSIPPFGPMVVWRLLSTFDCEEGCDIYDDVLRDGVTSIPVLFRKDPFGNPA